jgi:transcriptional regulator with XRE-family HTH domain
MPQLELDREALTRFRKRAFIDDDQDLAKGIGLSAATVSRVLSGEVKPSNQFIAGLLKLFGHAWFNELFKVVD